MTMELSPVSGNSQPLDIDESEEEVDMLIPPTDFTADMEGHHLSEYDISSVIKPPPRWTCCGELSAVTVFRRLGFVCLLATCIVAFAIFTISSSSSPPKIGISSVASVVSMVNQSSAADEKNLTATAASAPSAEANTVSGPSSMANVASGTSSMASPVSPPDSPLVAVLPNIGDPQLLTALPNTQVVSNLATTPIQEEEVPVDRNEMRRLAARMRPRDWNVSDSPKQFLHMHHMKTGGTSVDGLLNCAIGRWRTLTGQELPYYRVSECSGGVARCTQSLAINDTQSCPVHSAAVMSYCAALDAVDRFGWGDADKFTILRDPVDRVWSMYRYSLQGCYSCKTLEDVYQELDNGVTYSGICGSQLLNHQTENMLSAATRAKVATFTEQELIQEAIDNMNSRFAVVGLTGRFDESIEMITKVFPFLAENLTEVTNGQLIDTMNCRITHANQGRPPSCGTRTLDNATRQLIIQHNQRDVQLYAAALVHFEKQKKILLDGERFDDEADSAQTGLNSDESVTEMSLDESVAEDSE